MIEFNSISKNLEEGKIKLIDVLDIYHALSVSEQGRVNLLIKTLVDENTTYYYYGTARPAQMIAKYFNTDQLVHLENEPDNNHNVIMYRLSDLFGILQANNKSKALLKVPSILYSPCYTIDQLRGKIRSLFLLYKESKTNSIILEDVIPFCIKDFETILKLSLLTIHEYCISDIWNRIISLCDQEYNNTLSYYVEVFCSLLNFYGSDKNLLLDVIEIYSNTEIKNRNIEPELEDSDLTLPEDIISNFYVDENDNADIGVESLDYKSIEKVMSKLFKGKEVTISFDLSESDLCELKIQFGNKLFTLVNKNMFITGLEYDGYIYQLFLVDGDNKHIYGACRLNGENEDIMKVFQFKKSGGEYKFLEF